MKIGFRINPLPSIKKNLNRKYITQHSSSFKMSKNQIIAPPRNFGISKYKNTSISVDNKQENNYNISNKLKAVYLMAQKRNDGKKQVSMRMTPTQIKIIKQYALDNDMTFASVIEKAVSEMLTREKIDFTRK